MIEKPRKGKCIVMISNTINEASKKEILVLVNSLNGAVPGFTTVIP